MTPKHSNHERLAFIVATALLGVCLMSQANAVWAHSVPAPVGQDVALSASEFVSVYSGKCLDVTGVSAENGAVVQQWGCGGSKQTNQHWTLRPIGNYYRIVSVYSGKCLDVTRASRDNGAVVQQWECEPSSRQANQLWMFRRVGDYYRIVAVHSGKCLDVTGVSRDNGAVVQQWECAAGSGQANQLWVQRPMISANSSGLVRPESVTKMRVTLNLTPLGGALDSVVISRPGGYEEVRELGTSVVLDPGELDGGGFLYFGVSVSGRGGQGKIDVAFAPYRCEILLSQKVSMFGNGSNGNCFVVPGIRYGQGDSSLSFRVESTVFQMPIPDRLYANERLRLNDKLNSPDGRFSLILQQDFNLVLYKNNPRVAIWSTNTVGSFGSQAIMQGDGNFVLYKPGFRPVWHSRTDGQRGAYLVLQNDGNLVIYRGGRAIWATNTANQ